MHSKPSRIETPYPLSPDRFIETIKGIADSLPTAYRATVGMPGMIRHGVVISTPHYMTKAGPRTKIDPELQEQWSGFDMQNILSKKRSCNYARHRSGLCNLLRWISFTTY
jgi:polyphosphate glucokinase